MFDGLFEFCQLSAGGSAGELGENTHLKNHSPCQQESTQEGRLCEREILSGPDFKSVRIFSRIPAVMKLRQ